MARKKVQCVNCGFLSMLPPEDLRSKMATSPKDHFYREYLEIGRQAIAKETPPLPQGLLCRRFLWNMEVPKGQTETQIFEILNRERECLFFIAYQPGYTPNEHRELQREKANQRTILRASILGAAIGASAAILAQLVWALFSS